jgi:hypothetical protein
MFTVQISCEVELHPLQLAKVFVPDVAGAVSVTLVPLLYVRVKLLLPAALPLLSTGETPIATPLAGLVELTVSVYVSGRAVA